ncbi:MAG: methyl-accepting chemotaxis protein, partial [Parachlamydiaceae bacterium]|nr:methyl-accepting chemotaxis protein [Parachlamydiaceae bacterium]
VSELTSVSNEQTILAQHQEEATSGISASSDEILGTAKRLLLTVQEVSDGVNHTSGLASFGQKSLTDMEIIMQKIAEGSKEIVFTLDVLKEKASHINKVITTITKLADQTNLLSLNTAIEAERAGEFGRGFTVIANEIRKLADQTGVSILDIDKMISDITHAVSESVEGVNELSKQIKTGVQEISLVKQQLIEIIEGVHQLNDRFIRVSQGMQAQSVGAEQIHFALSELEKTAQSSSGTIFHLSETVQEISRSTEALIEALAKVSSVK